MSKWLVCRWELCQSEREYQLANSNAKRVQRCRGGCRAVAGRGKVAASVSDEVQLVRQPACSSVGAEDGDTP